MNFFKNVENFFFCIFGRIFNRRIQDDEDSQIDFKNYYRYSTMKAYLKRIVKENKRIASLETIGKSVEGREITMIRISSNGKVGKKPIIFVDAGIHGREWIAPATALHLIQQLIENPENEEMYRNFDWLIVPLVNPDGYEYCHTNDRFWRKNRHKCSKDSIGVDGNRNYSFMWGQRGSSPDEKSNNYRGKKPFSEPETRAIRNAALKYKDKIKMYLTLHSHGKMFLYPWGYTKDSVQDSRELLRVAKAANEAIVAAKGKPYRVGSSARLMYLMSGSSKDYFAGELGVKYSYTIELPGGGKRGFDLPPEKIEDVVSEMFAGFRGFWREMTKVYIETTTD